MAEVAVQLTDRIVSSLGVGKVFKDHTKSVNSLDFTVDGKYLITAGDDDDVHVYDCEKGEKVKSFTSKKYGVSNIKFVHSGTMSAVCASRNDFDHSLRYWDLYENKFLRYFKGHTAPVTGIDVHPYEDLFLSTSTDKTTLLWDLRKERPVARIPSKATPAASFDKQGLVFAVSAGDQKIHLFDSRSFDKGEFAYFDLSRYLPNSTSQVTKVGFSPCGKFISAATNAGEILTVDSFKGGLVGSYTLDAQMGECSPSFSPDSQYIMCGSTSGSINIFRTMADESRKSSGVVATLDGHSNPCRVALFNPVRCMIASSCQSVALWIPRQLA